MKTKESQPLAVKPRNPLLFVLGLVMFFAGMVASVFAVIVRGDLEDQSNFLLTVSLTAYAVSLTLLLVFMQDKDSRALQNTLARGVKVSLTDEQAAAMRPTEGDLNKAMEAAVAAVRQPDVSAVDIQAAVREVLHEQPQPKPWVRALFYRKVNV